MRVPHLNTCSTHIWLFSTRPIQHYFIIYCFHSLKPSLHCPKEYTSELETTSDVSHHTFSFHFVKNSLLTWTTISICLTLSCQTEKVQSLYVDFMFMLSHSELGLSLHVSWYLVEKNKKGIFSPPLLGLKLANVLMSVTWSSGVGDQHEKYRKKTKKNVFTSYKQHVICDGSYWELQVIV